MLNTKSQIHIERNIDILRYLVITDSFIDVEGNFKDSEFLLWARLSQYKYCKVYFTESDEKLANSIMEEYNCKIGVFSYENDHIIFNTQTSFSVCGYINKLEFEMIDKLDKMIRDTIFSFNFRDADFIVIEDSNFNRDLWNPMKQRKQIISAEKAIERLRVNLVRHNIYEAYIDREERIGNAEWMYLAYRLRTVFPSYQIAWECVSRTKNFNSKESEILVSLGHRLEFLLKTIDALIYNSTKTDKSTSIIDLNYHFTYFMLLATGCFDAVAWLSDAIYDINHTERMQVSIKNGIKSKFVAKIKTKNKNLWDFLTDTNNQNRIGVFYPFRDSLMHREILQPLSIDGLSKDSALIIDKAMLEALRVLSNNDGDWGIEYSNYMVSSVFIPKIIDHFIKLYNDLLDNFDWFEFMKKESQLSDVDIKKITDQDQKDFWKRYNFSQKPLFW